jgi:hypothetical protein
MKTLTTITLLLIALSCSAQSFRLIGDKDKVYVSKSINSWKVQRDTVILRFADLQTAAEAMGELTRSKSYYVTLDEEIIVNVMYDRKTCMYHIRLDGYPEAGVVSDHARILLTAKSVTDAMIYTRINTNRVINP